MAIELVLHPLHGGPSPWQSPLTHIEIGRDPACDLPFASAEHDMVSWRHARIESQGSQFLLSDLGSTNKTYLNGALVQGPRALAAGDQIRLGLEGPRIDVVRLTTAAPGLPSSPSGLPSATVVSPITPPPAHRRTEAAGQTTSLWPVFAAVGGIIAVGCLVGAVLYVATKSDATAPGNLTTVSKAETDTPSSAGNGVEGDPPQAASPIDNKTETPSSPAAPPATASPTKPAADDPLAEVRGALRAVVAEHPDGKLTALVTAACAIDSQTLVTTAGMAQELQSLRQAGWKIWAMHPVTRAKQAVEDILVHVGFERATGQPAEQIYFDQARLVVEGVLTEPASLATAAEQAKIEQGYPLIAVGFSHETGRPITRFDELTTLTAEGKVLAVTELQPKPGAPRLLHVQGDLSPSFRGGVVSNRQGKLVGLYAIETPAGVQPKIVYCALLASEALGPQAAAEAAKLWVPPQVESDAPESAAADANSANRDKAATQDKSEN